MQERKKKIRKRILIAAFVVFNVVVIAWTAISEFAGNDSATKFSDIKINWWFMIPAAGSWLAAVIAEIVKYALIMREVCGYIKWRLCIEVVLLGRYYDNITPSGVGGQPFQIYYLKKNGCKSSDGAAIPLVGFVSMQFSFVLLGLVFFIVFSRFIEVGFVKITSYLGLACYACFPVIILLFTFFEKPMIRVMHWFVYFIARLKLVRDPYATYNSWAENIKEYSVATRRVIKNAKLSLSIMGLGILYQVGICSIPFFVIMAFGGEINYLASLVNIISIYATITFIPTPGNAGAAEGSFYAIFSMLTTGYIFWAMLFWRFFVFYLFILIGLLIYFLNSNIMKNARREVSEEENK